MRYMGTLIVVRDMERAKRFYIDVMGSEIIHDFGANVGLTGGVSLQTADTWCIFTLKQYDEIHFKNNASELYFETDDLDSFVKKLETLDVPIVHPLVEHPWGQRGIRIYDPDGHVVEVSEDMGIVTKRFLDSGMSVEEAAARMGVPVEYVKSMQMSGQ
jgi:catechol 2,3-dioxygenase-like lactoylglutathione lyase family enzyme